MNDISSISRYSLFNDPDYFNRFIKNVESLFRRVHPFYNYYKAYLINDIGLDRCQVQSNISIEIANLEMHHTILTLYDEIFLITKYHLRVHGYVDTMIVLNDLINSHKENIIPLVMLSETNHELYHNNALFIPIECVFGNFMEFILKYKEGITYPIIYKLKNYLDNNYNTTKKDDLLELNNRLLSINNWYTSIGGDSIDYQNIYNDFGINY